MVVQQIPKRKNDEAHLVTSRLLRQHRRYRSQTNLDDDSKNNDCRNSDKYVSWTKDKILSKYGKFKYSNRIESSRTNTEANDRQDQTNDRT